MATATSPFAPSSAPPIVSGAEESPRLLTAEEYFETCRLEHSELIDGKVVELMPPGEMHGEFQLTIGLFLRAFVAEHNLGRVYGEVGFVLKHDPDLMRAPDVAFVEKAKERSGEARLKYFDGPPTLAVEIISPNDAWTDIEEKVQLYLEAGTRAVWLVEPRKKTLAVRTPDDPPRIYTRSDTLTGGEVLPGFELPLSQLFE